MEFLAEYGSDNDSSDIEIVEDEEEMNVAVEISECEGKSKC